MKYRHLCLPLVLFVCTNSVWAQEKPKRPVKNPPQYPNIIDLENKDQKPKQPEETKPADQQDANVTVDPNALTKAFIIIADELKSLSQEVRTLNIRQQLEIELMRQARVEQRISMYENQLRPIRERIGVLDAEEQSLQQMLTREALVAQTANMPTINREATINQLRYQYETRLTAIRPEKERLRSLEASTTDSLDIYLKLSDEIDKKIQQAEEKLRQFEASKEAAKTERTTPTPNQEKP